MNSYWAGIRRRRGLPRVWLAARLRNGPRTRDAVLLGVGLGMHCSRAHMSPFFCSRRRPVLRPHPRKLARVAPDVILV